MALCTYEARDLFPWLADQADVGVVDVRNDKDFKRFHVETPYPFPLITVSHYDFMERKEDAVARNPRDRSLRIVCAKEGSDEYVPRSRFPISFTC